MLHKAAHSFSPFKLQHLHSHIRSALNLNLGQNAGNASGASTSGAGSSSNALGSSSAQAGGAGGNAKYHAGRSYGQYHYHGRTTTPAANASSSTDGLAQNKQPLDDEDEAGGKIKATVAGDRSSRSLRWRDGRTFAGRQRSSSLSNPGLTSDLPFEFQSSTSSSALALDDPHASLPRSSPYSFNQAELQARYRHAFSQARRPRHERLLTLSSDVSSTAAIYGTHAHVRTFATSASSKTSSSSESPATTSLRRRTAAAAGHPTTKTAPSSPRGGSSPLPSVRQLRRNSTSTATTSSSVDASSTLSDQTSTQETVINAPSSGATPDVDASDASNLDELPAQQSVSQRHRSDSRDSSDLVWKHNPRPSDIEPSDDPAVEEWVKSLSIYARASNVSAVRTAVRAYRSAGPEHYTARQHGHAIRKLAGMKHLADYSREITDLYSDYFKNDLVPSAIIQGAAMRTYADRSQATYKMLEKQKLQNNAARLAPAADQWADGNLHTGSAEDAAPGSSDAMFSESSLAALRQQSDEDYLMATRILRSMGAEAKETLILDLNALLAAAAQRGDIDIALAAFSHLEGNPRTELPRATPRTFELLLLTYANARDKAGMQTVFEAFIKTYDSNYFTVKYSKASDFLDQSTDKHEPDVSTMSAGGPEGNVHAQGHAVDVWNAAIYGYLMLGDGKVALETLEQMMEGKGRSAKPDEKTLLGLVRGFAESGDLEAAFRWANRIHAQPTPSDLPIPPKIEDTLNAIIANVADIDTVQAAAAKTALIPQLASHIRKLSTPANATSVSWSVGASTPPLSAQSPTLSSPIGVGSLFSDVSHRSQSMSITPPPSLGKTLPAEEMPVLSYKLSSMIDDIIRKAQPPTDLYGIVKSESRNGVHAHPEALARLIEALAKTRSQEVIAHIQDLYSMAYKNIGSLAEQSDQTAAWAYLEDRMLIAMAILGDLKEAAVHRDRLLGAGAAPSADAYAAMITSAKDTTDDATVALELFEEARRFGVVPNLYLFNILISKLSKARRTQLALSYFEQMKALRLKPSAVTYGSVIAACCRTGDEKAAVYLFREMVRSPGFRPRVPPYNTMMQFFIATKGDRETALTYFDAMLRSGVKPTGHTYKLLLDAYGTLQPIDLDSVKDVFTRLLEDKAVSVTGNHWASLLTAYGTVQKDINRTLEIFDSISFHPSSADSSTVLPDVVCYEALFNGLLAMGKNDLIQKYLQRMQGQFVRPNAYICNILIRAHASAGDLEEARRTFESMQDPPSGVAAAGNHSQEKEKKTFESATASSFGTNAQQATPPRDGNLVYREPSTYEVMIKAEVAAGESERAQALLERAVNRAFPAAIIARLERMARGEEVEAPSFA